MKVRASIKIMGEGDYIARRKSRGGRGKGVASVQNKTKPKHKQRQG